MLIGAVVFVVADFLNRDDADNLIEVREADVQRLREQWVSQVQREPSDEQLASLIDNYIKEELYYREARRLGLDINDTIVRRRMVQKLTFLTEDVATIVPADDAVLREYYDGHSEDYRLPERYSFRHRFFSTATRDDAMGDAARVRQAQDAGDSFMLEMEFELTSVSRVRDLFGESFASSIADLAPSSSWQGPVESGFGWHLVQITGYAASEIESFVEARARVAEDFKQATRSAANEAYYSRLRQRYEVRRAYGSDQ